MEWLFTEGGGGGGSLINRALVVFTPYSAGVQQPLRVGSSCVVHYGITFDSQTVWS